ncbi:MAG: hypothetical protein AAFY08_14405 [Planctomycetota bacterium]
MSCKSHPDESRSRFESAAQATSFACRNGLRRWEDVTAAYNRMNGTSLTRGRIHQIAMGAEAKLRAGLLGVAVELGIVEDEEAE